MYILSAVASALQVAGAASAVSFCWGIAAVAYARTQVHVTETSLPKYILIHTGRTSLFSGGGGMGIGDSGLGNQDLRAKIFKFSVAIFGSGFKAQCPPKPATDCEACGRRVATRTCASPTCLLQCCNRCAIEPRRGPGGHAVYLCTLCAETYRGRRISFPQRPGSFHVGIPAP